MNTTTARGGNVRTVAISGASGLVGSALAASLESDGIEVRRLVRGGQRPGDGSVAWDPAEGRVDHQALEGIDALVHLAGENVGARRWTEARKARIRDSRVQGTRLLAEALVALSPRPRVMVSASGVGIYGLRGDELLTEDAALGEEGFLAELCREWESACAPAEDAGIRVVRCRLGVVFAKEGGALEKMRLPFRLGVGGRLGDGRQFMSWIALPDVVAGLRRAIDDDALRGPINLTSPSPVTNAALTKALGKALHRPTAFRVPGFAAKAVFGGEMAEEMLLGGQRAVPRKLEEAGFSFRYPEIDDALAYSEA